MAPDDLGWVSTCTRVYRAGRDARWWLRLSAHNAMVGAVVREGNRLVAEAAGLEPRPAGTLRQSLRQGRQ